MPTLKCIDPGAIVTSAKGNKYRVGKFSDGKGQFQGLLYGPDVEAIEGFGGDVEFDAELQPGKPNEDGTPGKPIVRDVRKVGEPKPEKQGKGGGGWKQQTPPEIFLTSYAKDLMPKDMTAEVAIESIKKAYLTFKEIVK